MSKNRNRKKITPTQPVIPQAAIPQIPIMPETNNKKGIYTEYLDARFTFDGLTKERKRQLEVISKLRDDRSILVIAADINKAHSAPISITWSDLVPVNDQLSVLEGDKIDVILETPGGLGEVAEDIVNLLRSQFNEVGIIIPGYAKSAGTLIAMAGDEILMEPASALGPIDAQISNQGKQFSADAFIKGLDKIKEEVTNSGVLNKAYIPILQAISPGEIQHAENALKFAKILVTQWLANYKFKNWDTHSSTKKTVTDGDKLKRAEEIADKLADHSRWLTHARSLKIEDLRNMKLLITDYSEQPELADAIRRYFVLLKMTFATPLGVYKVFETPKSQILSFAREENMLVQQQPAQSKLSEFADINFTCQACKEVFKIQGNLRKGFPIQPGSVPFPATNKMKCPKCGIDLDLTELRRNVEAKVGRKII